MMERTLIAWHSVHTDIQSECALRMLAGPASPGPRGHHFWADARTSGGTAVLRDLTL